MRILMASHGYPPVISGVTLIVQKLARAMTERGHDVTVVTASDSKDPHTEWDHGVRVVRMHSIPNPFWNQGRVPFLTQGELAEILQDSHPDVLHTHDAGPLGFQLSRFARETDVPVMASCHHVPRFVSRYLSWNGEPSEPIEAIVWAYSIWLHNHFDHVVFPNTTHRALFFAKGLEVPTTLISNGVDLGRYRPGDPDDALAKRYGLPPGPRILFVGRLMLDKEIDVLIRALSVLRKETDAYLLIVGQGNTRAKLEELVDDLGMGHAVRFLGFVPEEDLPALYRHVSSFAIVSVCEVQSLPTLQALATGLPVVAADALALPELVHDGVNGFLVQPGDPVGAAEALLKLVRDPNLAVRMGQESLKIAQPHAEARTFDQYEALYHRLAGR